MSSAFAIVYKTNGIDGTLNSINKKIVLHAHYTNSHSFISKNELMTNYIPFLRLLSIYTRIKNLCGKYSFLVIRYEVVWSLLCDDIAFDSRYRTKLQLINIIFLF